jgi:hypothetical protein
MTFTAAVHRFARRQLFEAFDSAINSLFHGGGMCGGI